jgi:hypothetical protein
MSWAKAAALGLLLAIGLLGVPATLAEALGRLPTCAWMRDARAQTLTRRELRLERELTLEHTRLENTRLRRESDLAAQVQGWLPLGTLLVGVLGGLYGFWRYRNGQRIARELRVEQSIGENLERIVDRPVGTNASARVVAALRNLDALLPPTSGSARKRERLLAQRKRVTDTLEAVVRNDMIEILTVSDARIPIVGLNEWAPFRERVNTDVEMCRFVILRYLDTLTQIGVRHPIYTNSVQREADGRYVAASGSLNSDTLIFQEALAGFVLYMGFIGTEVVRRELLEDLAKALNNQLLPEQLFAHA